MPDPDDWPEDPPSYGPWQVTEDSSRVVSDRIGYVDDLHLTKAQAAAETKRRKKTRGRLGFR